MSSGQLNFTDNEMRRRVKPDLESFGARRRDFYGLVRLAVLLARACIITCRRKTTRKEESVPAAIGVLHGLSNCLATRLYPHLLGAVGGPGVLAIPTIAARIGPKHVASGIAHGGEVGPSRVSSL